MFSKRDKYHHRVFINKDSFIKLTEELRGIGFDKIVVKIPLDEASSERAGKKPIPLDKFLKQDRNYKGLILFAKRGIEEIRILFKNQGEGNFLDDIFPSVGSNTTYNFYVSTKNPVETQGLSLYLKDFFQQYKVGGFFTSSPVILGCLLFLAPMFIQFFIRFPVYFIYIFWVTAFVLTVIAMVNTPQTGLFFHSPQDAKKLPKYLERLKEEWLIILVTAILTFGITWFFQRIGK